MISDATRALEQKIDSTNLKIDAVNTSLGAKLDAQRSMIAIVSVMLGIIGLAIAAGPTVAKFIP